MFMNKLLKWLFAVVVLLSLAGVNHAIYQRQQTLKQGTVVILALAPVDPRSLMQGDYMALDYALGRQLQRSIDQRRQACRGKANCTAPAASGQVVVMLDARHHAIAATFDRQQPLQPGQVLMKYRLAANRLHIGTPSYFFEEGQAERFAKARYGEFRVARDGTALLTHLLDEQGVRITTAP
ncbi:GDYXXLXY domain-containing protein [Serratia sp. AKBS12]|uniref:GDYXXLXY domain-containing protein n=1 Tax=Serratia sp. AKBS12 TaxID=2974597 RepID=UPI002164FFE2|nr:GDYXXLXY domain-containing protein [Serratia sp. AKBS12]MCS3409161.1 GDYXXLXY domain-containing protein [Serratia sp. AKBS12]HEI8865487.1 GDYXXLXY domain-containing protein [Serratia odorifera]